MTTPNEPETPTPDHEQPFDVYDPDDREPMGGDPYWEDTPKW